LESITRKGLFANLFANLYEVRLPEDVMCTHYRYPGLTLCESGSKLLLDWDPDFFLPEIEKKIKNAKWFFLDLQKGFKTSGQATSTPE
jgi:hypothetical protein